VLEFMIIGMPRSGTTWAANWLTTDKTICLHDPLWTHHYTEWDNLADKIGKRVGISCTGIGFWPHWLNDHPARKVIVHRPVDEINMSLRRINKECWDTPMNLGYIKGRHVDWQDLFNDPEPIWNHLLPDIPFNQQRHKLLRQMKIEPVSSVGFENIDLYKQLMSEIDAHPTRGVLESAS